MKCKTCKQLIHQLMDGELDQRQTSDVCKHLRECDDCQSYHHELVRMSAALREPDREPPGGFRSGWQSALREASRPRKRYRPAVLVPAIATGAAAVFFVSTAIVNPQALGLSGNNLSGEWFAVDRTSVQETSVPSAPPDDGVDVEFFSKKEPKPNVLDFESSDYSETTTSESSEPEIHSAGEIISTRAPETDENPTNALPDAAPAPEESPEGYEVQRSVLSPWSNFAMAALTATDVSLTETESDWVLEGLPERIEQLLAEYGVNVPEGTTTVRIVGE